MTFYFLLVFPSSSGIWNFFSISVTHRTLISLHFSWSQSRNIMVLLKNINNTIHPQAFLYAKYVLPYLVTWWLLKIVIFIYDKLNKAQLQNGRKVKQKHIIMFHFNKSHILNWSCWNSDHNLLVLFSCFNWQWYLYLYFFHSQNAQM